MNELVPNKSKFENALVKIEESSKENQQLPELRRFQEKGGLFSLFPKNVTGSEMNNFATQVQENLIIANDKINKMYKQFTEVYIALDALDKEYIAGIVGAFNEAVEAMKKAEDAQRDVNNTVKLLNETVEKIKEFNKKVSFEFSRLDSENWRENALKHQKELEDLDNKANEIVQTIESYKEQHNELVMQLEEYKKEKARNTKSLIICWSTTGVVFIAMIVLIMLIVFHVI